MNTTPPVDPAFYQGFIARQALFDIKRNIWGYEILYRQSLEHAQGATDHKTMLEVATRAFLSPQWQQSPNSYLMVTLDPNTASSSITGVLPKGRSVFTLSEEALFAPGMHDTLLNLRQENYLMALSDYTGQVEGASLLNMMDIIAVDMQRANLDELFEAVRRQQGQHPVQIMARKVEDVQTFTVAKNAGCSLFQGFFFQKPERISSKVVSSSLAGSLGILQMLEREDPDISALAQAIQKDVSLSYRLLKFLNSPYFGFAREVSSIKVALILAGWQQMRTWLRLVLITEMKPKHKPNELVFLSAQRGRFLELAAQRTGGRRVNSERMLLLGLFSLLDSIFDMQMIDIVGSLPLDQELKDTLCLKPTPLVPWLQLVHSFERAEWDDLSSRFEALGIDPVVVAACYTESMQWAHAIFSFLN
ncbi:MAG: HDOD domain-containing protein [Humidesulfovibrio sp.]|uniref:EAL and HDOD domain-containing protein n=1 Tax=Humidesulfovibrio sp. TaxID=2910988 RepID=UPI0027F2FB4F|nr:HDOD domain-containing protein [Humidesulfovibrio sp.]MDQ7833782.1 HDOD domain-containing protein [Humidesulfovibrio sp.]